MADIGGNLIQRAEKLANGKSGHSPTSKPGYLQHKAGKWRDPKLHAQILDLYGQAVAADAEAGDKLGFALFRRGLEHFYVGHYDEARRDLHSLVAMGSSYAQGAFPIWIALASGNKAEAKLHLDAWNEVNRLSGRPKQRLSDFQV